MMSPNGSEEYTTKTSSSGGSADGAATAGVAGAPTRRRKSRAETSEELFRFRRRGSIFKESKVRGSSSSADGDHTFWAETFLLTRLTMRLLRFFGFGITWIIMAVRLILFALILLPGFAQLIYLYIRSDRIYRNIRYGAFGRSYLDVFVPKSPSNPSQRICKVLSASVGGGAVPRKKKMPSGYDKRTPSKTPERRKTWNSFFKFKKDDIDGTLITGFSSPPPAPSSGDVKDEGDGRRRYSRNRRPVVVFVSGGAWIIGYKCWGALIGMALSNHGIVVVTPDYRNFPQGTIRDMVSDVGDSMSWVMANIHHFGGDPDNVHLIGQSAGAHISLLTLLNQMYLEHKEQSLSEGLLVPPSSPGAELSWRSSELSSWVGISGPYNLQAIENHLHRRGFYKHILGEIMENDLFKISPSRLLRAKGERSHMNFLPYIYLFHGTEDKCVPESSSLELAFVLSQLGAEVMVRVYNGKTHTDPIIEDPMRGKDQLLSDLLLILKEHRSEEEYYYNDDDAGQESPEDDLERPFSPMNRKPGETFVDTEAAEKRLLCDFLIDWARVVNPF
eukprot:TRINITY_DN20999_c0_g2_i1.p1 TRINITY_DN20999_c0_g2~~TRINITY_DN20999_c0_g2_i1.p1  ORF type:complete len:558 (+),score=102.24 TRINITY_DN20999_c0_g2_i1:124-1797(+)